MGLDEINTRIQEDQRLFKQFLLEYRILNDHALKPESIKIDPECMLSLSSLNIVGSRPFRTPVLPSTLSDKIEIFEYLYLHTGELPKNIEILENLRELKLQNCNLQDFPEEIFKFKDLEVLEIYDETISIPSRIAEFSKLRKLCLADLDLETIPAQIGELGKLEELNLNGNRISRLPDTFHQLNLKKLRLNRHDGLGSLFDDYPQDIMPLDMPVPKGEIPLQKLEHLELRERNLPGLPEFVYQLPRLKTLDLYSNNLSQIDPRLAQLKTLEELILYGSPIEEIPPEILNLPKLRSLLGLKHLIEADPDLAQSLEAKGIDY